MASAVKPANLYHAKADKVRWVIRNTWWGLLVLITLIVLSVAALVALWLLVPAIEKLAAELLAALSGMLGWIVDKIARIPDWLSSLL